MGRRQAKDQRIRQLKREIQQNRALRNQLEQVRDGLEQNEIAISVEEDKVRPAQRQSKRQALARGRMSSNHQPQTSEVVVSTKSSKSLKRRYSSLDEPMPEPPTTSVTLIASGPPTTSEPPIASETQQASISSTASATSKTPLSFMTAAPPRVVTFFNRWLEFVQGLVRDLPPWVTQMIDGFLEDLRLYVTSIAPKATAHLQQCIMKLVRETLCLIAKLTKNFASIGLDVVWGLVKFLIQILATAPGLLAASVLAFAGIAFLVRKGLYSFATDAVARIYPGIWDVGCDSWFSGTASCIVDRTAKAAAAHVTESHQKMFATLGNTTASALDKLSTGQSAMKKARRLTADEQGEFDTLRIAHDKIIDELFRVDEALIKFGRQLNGALDDVGSDLEIVADMLALAEQAWPPSAAKYRRQAHDQYGCMIQKMLQRVMFVIDAGEEYQRTIRQTSELVDEAGRQCAAQKVELQSRLHANWFFQNFFSEGTRIRRQLRTLTAIENYDVLNEDNLDSVLRNFKELQIGLLTMYDSLQAGRIQLTSMGIRGHLKMTRAQYDRVSRANERLIPGR